ncbi:MAG: hypothetical protein ACUVSY_05110 [Roseiflexus sp.]
MNVHSTNDEHDAALHEVLRRSGALDPHKSTTDLVAGTLRRLPHTPPRIAAQRATIRQTLSRAAIIAAVALLVIPAAVGAFNLIRGTETPMTTFAGMVGQSRIRAVVMLAAIEQSLDIPLVRALLGVLVWLAQIIAVVLTLGFWPRRSAAAGMTLLAIPFRAFGTGLLAIGILIAGVAALLTLLTATLAGLPIAAIVFILAHLPVALGIAISARALGFRLARHSHLTYDLDRHLIMAAAMLALPVAMVTFISIPAALPVLYILAIPGIGALIHSQGGLRPVSAV